MFEVDCEGCAQRREALKKIADGFKRWVANPMGAPQPGSPEWAAEQERLLNEASRGRHPDSTR